MLASTITDPDNHIALWFSPAWSATHIQVQITIVLYDFHPHDLQLISLLSSPKNFICSIHCHYTHCIFLNYKSTHISTRPEKYKKSNPIHNFIYKLTSVTMHDHIQIYWKQNQNLPCALCSIPSSTTPFILPHHS
jgi:hypothetical protein